jgi:DNA end-binding protein Ku
MHFMYFANEVRDFGQIPRAEGEKVPERETDLAENLIDKMSSAEFELEKYRDEYRERVLTMIDQKVKGQEITVAPPAPERQLNASSSAGVCTAKGRDINLNVDRIAECNPAMSRLVNRDCGQIQLAT